jgi:hypothetical protein
MCSAQKKGCFWLSTTFVEAFQTGIEILPLAYFTLKYFLIV